MRFRRRSPLALAGGDHAQVLDLVGGGLAQQGEGHAIDGGDVHVARPHRGDGTAMGPRLDDARKSARRGQHRRQGAAQHVPARLRVIAVDPRRLAGEVGEALDRRILPHDDEAAVAGAFAARRGIARRRHQRDLVLELVGQRIAAGLGEEQIRRQPQLIEIARFLARLRHIAQAGRAPMPRQPVPPQIGDPGQFREPVHRSHGAHHRRSQNVTGLAAIDPGATGTPSPMA